MIALPPVCKQETAMRTAIYILMGISLLLTILCYALMVVAHEADEKAERMYKAWKESKKEMKTLDPLEWDDIRTLCDIYTCDECPRFGDDCDGKGADDE